MPRIHDQGRFLGWTLLVAAIALVACCPRGEAAPAAKPNLVLFLGDDHSVWDSGCYGNQVVRTPNIDRLANEGMRFERAFTATAMCAPARSMLYTGLLPHRNGCHMNHGPTREGVKSLPHYLEPLGYRVVLAGKKHIKPKSVYPFEYLEQKEIAKVIQGSSPFCLVIASDEPHGPHEQGGYSPDEVPIPPYLPDTPSIRRNQAAYYTDIDLLNKEIGSTLQLLKKSGKEDNTLFVYAGDHGSGLMAKWTCYEAGLRVPFIVRWPGRIEAGSTTNAMVCFADVLPTFLQAAGAEPPDDIDGRGFLDVLTGETDQHRELIFGAHTNQGIISGAPYPVRSVRDERYKYIINLKPNGRPTNVSTYGRNYREVTQGAWAEWKAEAKTDPTAAELLTRVMDRPAEELYDLQEDPWELNNLASDPAQAERKAQLKQELERWMEQQGDRGLAAELAVKPHQSMQQAK